MDLGLTYEESKLIDLLKDKDQQAFTYLYDKYASVLYCVVIQIVREEEIANEVLPDVFISIYRKIDTYDTAKAQLCIWMMQIARNVSIEKIRSGSYRQSSNQISTTGKTISISAKPAALDNYGLKKILHQLNDEQKMLIDLSYFKGLNYEQISKEMSVPLNSVKIKLRNALSELRKLLCK